MITNQSVNVTSLAEPIAAINKSHQQLPPQRSLRARSSLKTLGQTSLLPEQQSNTHNDHDPHHKISIISSEKDNKAVTPEERRGSALVSEIMRRLSRAQPALPTHDIHIHDTSNLSEENENNKDDVTANTGQAKKKSLSDLPILRIPVPPSILKTSSESIPHKVEGRKIQFIDPILSNSSSEVDSMSNASSSLLEQTPDKRLGVNHPSDFIVSSDNNNDNNNNREGSHSLEQMNGYYHESTPLKKNEVIVSNVTQNNDAPIITNFNDVNKNNNTAKSLSSPSSVSSSSSSSSSSSVVSSPAFGSLESTPHQHNIPQVQSSLPSLAQVHPLMETNRPRDNKELARVSQQASNTNHTQGVPKEVHRAAPLPARPRMSREPAKTNKSNSNNIVVTKVEKSKSSPKKEGSENDICNNKHETNNKENDLHKVSSNNDSQDVDYSNSAEDHFSIPPFRHEPHASASNTLQTSEQSELTKAELIRQLQKYKEEVRQNAERSLRPSGQSVSQTQNVKPAETIQVNRNTQANNKTSTDSKAENKSKANSKELDLKKSENKNDNSQELEEEHQQEQTDIVEVPLIDTSLTPEIEYELPHVPSVNQVIRQETAKIRTTAQEPLPKENTLLNNKNNSSHKYDANNLANHINNEQTEAQRQKTLEQVERNVSAEQPESTNSKVENAYDGNSTTQNMLYLLLYNQLAGSKNKHSLEYLINRWEKRQKRDLAKRMQEVLGIDTDLGQHQTKEKSKHQKHHKSYGSVKREHHHTRERSGSKKHKEADKYKRHQSHKHKHPSPHKHKHHHHHKDDNSSKHVKHQEEQKDNKEVQWERHKEQEEDHNNKENKENKPDYPTTDILNDFAHEDSKPNNYNNNNTSNVKRSTAELSGNEEEHVDYKTLSLEELKAAARRYGLEFAEKTQN